jgi:hypothetical protein
LSWSTTARGVFAGANMAYHCDTSTLAMPCSASVGTSGSSAERLLAGDAQRLQLAAP